MGEPPMGGGKGPTINNVLLLIREYDFTLFFLSTEVVADLPGPNEDNCARAHQAQKGPAFSL
jgi:hypothetical protein